MPLIVITGYPSSGKTHRALQLVSYFQQRASTAPSSKPLRVHHITDASLHISHSVYDLESKTAHERSANASEKDARATVYAAVKRVLSDNDVVILDAAAGNYIKGWRYQLYCEAKAMLTPSCVVHVGTPVEKAREINEERLKRRGEKEGTGKVDSEDGGREETMEVSSVEDEGKTGASRGDEEHYESSTWENLVFRYEEPNGMARWDSPLFTVVWDDAMPPCEAIWEAMIGTADGKKIVVKPNAATVFKPAPSEGYLYELDRTTQEVVGRITQWGRDHVGEGGGEVVLEDGEGKLVVVLPSNPVALPALQRLRRQFINMNRQNAVSRQRIRASFVSYLNDDFEAA